MDTTPDIMTNRGAITTSGAGGLGAFIAGRVTFNNAAGASIVSRLANGIITNGGGTFTNASTIVVGSVFPITDASKWNHIGIDTHQLQPDYASGNL
ncbi:hypothetical protein [Paraburkholderia terrae]|uniref:hypothetical protein n=1 Tax=Paraburkholderia terrae TaxID=311230 RepID=UPI001EE293A7|nr:hypothetical protein [Paraburkholderia terrae]GJH05800.1 hypothetical protein CBA19C8_34605 [Paraburkholderia terrae]